LVTAYERPAVAVDLTVFSILEGRLHVLLIRRGEQPFLDHWALPGGFVRVGDAATNQGEDLDEAAARELAEETGLQRGSVFLEQLYTFGSAFRDPRMRVISVAYYALVPPDLAMSARAGSDARATSWSPVDSCPALAFDHDQILAVALERIRGKLDYSTIALELVPDPFTAADLRKVHETIEGRPLDPGNFRRRVNRLIERGVLSAAPGRRHTGKRPAQLYRFTQRDR
jgi:8-oxo-dGTP diphosphatase